MPSRILKNTEVKCAAALRKFADTEKTSAWISWKGRANINDLVHLLFIAFCRIESYFRRKERRYRLLFLSRLMESLVEKKVSELLQKNIYNNCKYPPSNLLILTVYLCIALNLSSAFHLFLYLPEYYFRYSAPRIPVIQNCIPPKYAVTSVHTSTVGIDTRQGRGTFRWISTWHSWRGMEVGWPVKTLIFSNFQIN